MKLGYARGVDLAVLITMVILIPLVRGQDQSELDKLLSSSMLRSTAARFRRVRQRSRDNDAPDMFVYGADGVALKPVQWSPEFYAWSA